MRVAAVCVGQQEVVGEFAPPCLSFDICHEHRDTSRSSSSPSHILAMAMQALVEESARQQRVQEQQRQLEERQKVQQALFQVPLPLSEPICSDCMPI